MKSLEELYKAILNQHVFIDFMKREGLILMIICPLYYVLRKYNLYLDDLEEQEYQKEYEEEMKKQKENGENSEGETDKDDLSDEDKAVTKTE